MLSDANVAVPGQEKRCHTHCSCPCAFSCPRHVKTMVIRKRKAEGTEKEQRTENAVARSLTHNSSRGSLTPSQEELRKEEQRGQEQKKVRMTKTER